MFGTMPGARKLWIHQLFPDPSDFARVVVDVYRVVRPTVSFLDLTSVIEGQGVADAVRPVGLILGGTDAVALDTLAAHVVGYDDLTIWTSIHGRAVGLGSNRLDRIIVRGEDWSSLPKTRLLHPAPELHQSESLTSRLTRRINNTILRRRPVISIKTCTGYGACANRCPVGAIQAGADGKFSIDLSSCADCGCCLRVCDVGAVRSEFIGIGRVIRIVSGRSPKDERGHACDIDTVPSA